MKKGSLKGSIIKTIMYLFSKKVIKNQADETIEVANYNRMQMAILGVIIQDVKKGANLDSHLDTVNNSLLQVESDKILSEDDMIRMNFYLHVEATLLHIKCLILEKKIG